MKKVFLALGLIALLAGCASNDNGMGGTSDQYSNSSGQYHSNATLGTGTSTATNNAASKALQAQ